MPGTAPRTLVVPHPGTPLFDERLREAVAAGLVSSCNMRQHATAAAERALAIHLNPFGRLQDFRKASQEFQLAADLCRVMASDTTDGAHKQGCRCPECDPNFNDPREIERLEDTTDGAL